MRLVYGRSRFVLAARSKEVYAVMYVYVYARLLTVMSEYILAGREAPA